MPFDKGAALRHNNGFGVIKHAYASPIAVVITGFVPTWPFLLRIIMLAPVEIAHADRAGGRLPSLVAGDDGGAAIGIGDVQLEQERQPVTIKVTLSLKAEVAAEPAIPQQRAQGIFSWLQEVGHVIGLILNAFFVAGPARGQQPIPHALAVEVQFIKAQAGGIDACRCHFTVQRKGGAQQRSRLWLRCILVPIGSDPISLPICVIEQPHLPSRRGAPRGRCIIFIPDAHPPVATLRRLKHRPAIGDMQGLVRADFLRVPQPGTPVVSDLDLIGTLFCPAVIGLQLSTKAGLWYVEADGIGEIFAGEGVWCAHGDLIKLS